MIFCNCTIVFSDIEPKLLMKTSQLTSVGLPGKMSSLFCPRTVYKNIFTKIPEGQAEFKCFLNAKVGKVMHKRAEMDK